MATFSPPLREGNEVRGPRGNRLNSVFKYMDGWSTGVTIWKDQLGAFHESLEPYLGGEEHHVYDTHTAGPGPIHTVTTDDDVMSLANAEVVYLGGHVHTISEAAADELVAAGYGSSLITRESIAESFNKANGALGPDLTWTRKVFTNDHPFEVVSNQIRVFSDEEGSHEDIQVPTPNVDSPNAEMSLTITNVARTGSGEYVVDLGGVLRLETRNADSNYRGYACAVGRNNIFVPPVDLWHMILFRIDGIGNVHLIGSSFLLLAQVTLPGTFTFSANGSTITATFTHAGSGGTMSINATDSTYSDGLVAIGGSAVLDAGETATIDADNFTAGPA